jgi:hypothetical protein
MDTTEMLDAGIVLLGTSSASPKQRVFYDCEGRTLAVWLFTEGSRDYICEETGDEVVLMKDASGQVVGFEKLNFSISIALRLMPDVGQTDQRPARSRGRQAISGNAFSRALSKVTMGHADRAANSTKRVS